MDKEKFQTDMAAFSFKHHQDFLTYFKMLEKFGYTIGDIENYIELKKSEFGANIESQRNAFAKCPDCGSRILILSVNDTASTLIGDDSKSVLMCQNQECMYTEYSNKSTSEWLKELSKK
jgi:hypothetical protein